MNSSLEYLLNQYIEDNELSHYIYTKLLPCDKIDTLFSEIVVYYTESFGGIKIHNKQVAYTKTKVAAVIVKRFKDGSHAGPDIYRNGVCIQNHDGPPLYCSYTGTWDTLKNEFEHDGMTYDRGSSDYSNRFATLNPFYELDNVIRLINGKFF